MSNANVFEIAERISASPLLRVLLLGFLILLLLIPIGMIHGVIQERQHYRNTAAQEVTSIWGGTQALTGPWITVPYVHYWNETRTFGNRTENFTRKETRHATFLPDTLRIVGDTQSQTRLRGIFRIPLYSLSLNVSGHFTRPDFSAWGTKEEDVLWDQAYLSFGIADAKGIAGQSHLTWNEADLDFLPGSGDPQGATSGIHVPLKTALEGERFDFAFPLALNGSEAVLFTPYGGETIVELTSDWPDPSFRGSWLPTERTVDANGFTAAWSIPFLGRNYPQQWKTLSEFSAAAHASQFGVTFLVPVDNYRMALRSVKYAALFLLLTFTTLWLFQVLNDVRIHPVQYLLVGAGMSVFYLLELSLAEHLGFQTAYIVASAAVVVLLGAYGTVVLENMKRAAVLSLVTSFLYGYLYVTLRMQDYSLLVGAIALFAAIAAVMFLTRKINWYGANPAASTSIDDPSGRTIH